MALEPITRQEKIIAGQDLIPITRMEMFLKNFGGGGGSDDVYLIKHITNYDTRTEEFQGDYAGALDAFNSGKSLKFVDAEVYGGEEHVNFESFAYHCDNIDSFFRFVCYTGKNFLTCTLKESGITVGHDDTHVGSLYVDIPDQLYIRSPENKLFRINVNERGELTTVETQ